MKKKAKKSTKKCTKKVAKKPLKKGMKKLLKKVIKGSSVWSKKGEFRARDLSWKKMNGPMEGAVSL